jgi:hypothetical protein
MSARWLWRAAWLIPAALAIRLFAPGHGLQS